MDSLGGTREAPGRQKEQPARHQGGRIGLIGQPARHQGGTREAGKDLVDSLGGTREAGKDLLDSLGGTREAGKDHFDSLGGTREAPGRQERTYWTAGKHQGGTRRSLGLPGRLQDTPSKEKL